MRKLLLASVAVLGGTLGAANAQSFTQAPSVVPTPVPFTLMPSPTSGPGTISVRINAKLNFYMQAGSDSGRNTQVTPVPGSNPPAGASGTSLGSPQSNGKLQDYQFAEYARLYFNLDGIAGNGLKYGAFLEVRQDNAVAPGGSGGTFGSTSGQNRSRGAMYFRNEGGYLGTDQLGFVRFGSTYQPSVLFATGTFENFNDGAWDGDLAGFFSQNTTPTWPFPDIGPFYVPGAIVYLSPQFYGVDFAASFSPSTAGVDNTAGNCPYALSTPAGSGIGGNTFGGNTAYGCDALSSTSGPEYNRPRNEAQIYARYRGAFGPVGIAVQGGGIFSGKVGDNATPQRALQYDGYSLGDGGIVLTYGGLAVGGHVTAGRANGGFGLDPKGAKDSFAWLAGASYAIGPVVVGASYYDYMSAGSNVSNKTSTLIGNRNEYGVAAGGTYNFAPGMNIFLSYLYGHRKELGVDLLSGATAAGATNVLTHNNVQSQGVSIGTQFRW